MITLTWVFLGAVLPAVIGMVVPLVVFYRRCPRWLAKIVSIITIALGFEAGFMATYGMPKIPPVEAHEWLLVVLRPAALIVAILTTATWIPIAAIWLLRFFLAFGAAPLLLQPYFEHTWTAAQSMTWLGSLGAGSAMFWFLMIYLASKNNAAKSDNTPAYWLPWALAIVAGGTGITILMSGSQTLGQLGISLAAVFIGVAIASWVTRKTVFLPASHLDLTITLLLGIWLCGYFYAQLSATHALLLTLAPLAAWVGHLLPNSKHTFRNILVRLIPVLIVVIGIVVSAAVKFTQESAYDGY